MAELAAQFDDNDHAITPGWATRWERPYQHIAWYRTVRCRLLGHIYPSAPPVPPNGHSPSNFVRCRGCSTLLGWHVVGQHRYGGLDADRPPVVPL
jgi:hypothetical protein